MSGGVAVGAVADLMIQPYGAMIAGSLAGMISTFGYQVVQVTELRCHVTYGGCNKNNLYRVFFKTN